MPSAVKNLIVPPEQLAIMRKVCGDPRPEMDRVADDLDRRLREKTDAQAEVADRNRHTRRRAAVLAR